MAISALLILKSLKQTRIALSALTLDSLDITARYFEETKPLLKKIYSWPPIQDGAKTNDLTKSKRETVRRVSVILNRLGFMAYREAISVDLLTEDTSDVFIKAFIHLRPYLELERDLRGENGSVWYIRKYFLMMVPLCQEYMRMNHPEHKLASYLPLVTKDMLEPKLQKWVLKNGGGF